MTEEGRDTMADQERDQERDEERNQERDQERGQERDQERGPLLGELAGVYRSYLTAVVLHGQAAADALGQNPTDLYALNALELAGPLTTGVLAERIGLSQSATTRLVDRLERAGWVRRGPDPVDRRRVVVAAVPVPEEADEKAFGPARRRMAEVFDGFDDDELRVLRRYFERAAPALRAATAETKGLEPVEP